MAKIINNRKKMAEKLYEDRNEDPIPDPHVEMKTPFQTLVWKCI